MGKPSATPPEPAASAAVVSDPPAATQPVSPPPADSLRPESSIGRYIVLGTLGSGGMGVIYSALDPELDRRVAVKLLHTGVAGTEGPRHRMVREARALARLSHPNVVQIYDAGIHHSDVFITMELIEGRSLKEWLDQQPRPTWQGILRAYLEAGKGLSAAHHRGLIHRDFKPANVLIGTDGRVRVADFGLARADDRTEGQDRITPHASLSTLHLPGDHLSAQLTQAGTIVGTPGYMAPEQHVGGQVDHRADQFSFCVALYEGLYGERPFAGDTLADLVRAMHRGAVRAPAPGVTVPAWLRRALLRGLSYDPHKRFPSMDALLQALAHEPRVRRRRVMLAASALALLVLITFPLGQYLVRRATQCRRSAEHLRGIWDPPRKAALRAAFINTGQPFAAAVWQSVQGVIDNYTTLWVSMRTQACEATRLHGEQSEAVLDQRMACLDSRLSEVDALVQVLDHADRAIVEKALQAASDLPELATCSDLKMLLTAVPPPQNPETRKRVTELRRQIADIRARVALGKHRETLSKAEALAQQVKALGYPPLVAEAYITLGAVRRLAIQFPAAEQILEEAVTAAIAAGDEATTFEGELELARLSAGPLNRFADAYRWLRVAEATQAHLGRNDVREGELETVRATLAGFERRYPDAIASYRRAVELLGNALGPTHVSTMKASNGLANAYEEQGRYDEALEIHRRLLTERERLYGSAHPEVATSYANIGIVYEHLGKYAEAEAAHLRARDLRIQVYGPSHPWVSASDVNMAGLYLKQGRYEQARDLSAATLASWEKAFGPHNNYLTEALVMLAYAHLELGQLATASAEFERARAIAQEHFGADHLDVAVGLLGLSTVARLQGHTAQALAHAERAHQINVERLGMKHPSTVQSGVVLGQALSAAGQLARSETLLEQMLQIGGRLQLDPLTRGEARFALAQVLARKPDTRKRARELAEQAQQDYAEVPGHKKERARITAWLAHAP